MLKNLVKVAALGALGVASGSAVLYVLLVWVFAPTPTGGAPGSGGGIDRVEWYVLALAMLVPVAVLAGAHVAFARQLRDGRRPIDG